jgi:L-Ala-D/L-Glu epimerase / N-acetyl-D-glutamate racemase
VDSVKISRFEIAELGIELKRPFITSLRRVETVHDIIIKVYTDTALVGYGEACAVTAITGATNKSVITELIRNIFPSMLGHEIDANDIFERLHHSSSHPEAKACVDIALYDLLAKQKEVSLHTYLGSHTDTLRTDLTISVGDTAKMCKDTLEALDAGFKSLKIKLDADADLNIQRLHKIIEVLPAEASLRLDPNQALDLESALHILEQIDTTKIECIEQPFKADDLDALKALTLQQIIPTLADESLFNSKDAQYLLDNEIADMLNIKLMKSGGIYEALKISAVAKEYKKNCMIGSMLEGPISLLAAAHFGLCAQNVTMADLDSPLYLKEHPLLEPFHMHKDEIRLSNEPGLGIDTIMNRLDLFQAPLYS